METITKTTTDTSLSFSDIADIIDNHFETETNCLFVTNKQLAESICEYVLNKYDLMDEDMEINDELLDYYVTMYFNNDRIHFFCETARGNDGDYKLHDIEDDYVDYYIFVDMDKEVVFDKLLGENGSWNFVSVDIGECCDCNKCNECEDKGITYDELLDIFTEKIQEVSPCPSCIKDVLDEFADIFIPEVNNCDKFDDCADCPDKCQEYYDCENEDEDNEECDCEECNKTDKQNQITFNINIENSKSEKEDVNYVAEQIIKQINDSLKRIGI